MPGVVDTLLFKFIGSTSHLTANIASAKKAVQGLTAAVFTTKAVMVGGLVAIGVAALVAFRKSVSAIAGLDAALREVSTLLPGTIEGLDGVRDSLIAISNRTGEPPEMLTEGFYQAVSAGFTDLADALFLTEVSSKAAVAGLTDSGTAIDAITTLLNAYGLEASQALEISDKLFATVAEGKIRFADLAQNIGTVAATGKIIGLSIDEVLASVAALTKNTGQVEESFTALNRAMLGIIKRSSEAQEFADALGISLTSDRIASEGWIPILEEMNEKLGGSAEAFIKLNPNLRQFKGVVILAGEGLDDLKQAMDRVATSTGATQTAMDKINEGIIRQKALISNRLDNAWKILGTVTLPIAEEAYRQIAQILSFLETTEDKRIRLLNELGLGEEALALQRLQLVEDFENQVDKATDRAQNRVDQVLNRMLVLTRGGGFKDFVTSLFGGFDASNLTLTKAIKRVRDELESYDFLILEPLQQRAVLEEAITELMGKRNHLDEKDDATLLSVVSQLRGAVTQIDNRIALQRVLDKLLNPPDKEEDDDDDDPPGLPDAEHLRLLKEYKEKMEETRDVVTEFGDRLAALKEFGLDLGDEVPAAVGAYLDTLDGITDQFEEQREAFIVLAANGDQLAIKALEYLDILTQQRRELEANKDAIIDSLRFTEEFGESILEVFLAIPDAQRGILVPAVQSLQFAIDNARRAKTELESLTEGTEAYDAALARFNTTQVAAKAAFDAVEKILRAFVKDGKLLEKILDSLKKKWEDLFGKTEEGKKDWKEIGELIESSARAALSLADALGIVDEDTRKILNGFIDIGDAISKIASGNLLAGVIQGLGGVVGVIGGLFGGGGTDPAAVARQEAELKAGEERKDALVHNTERLAELSRNIVELAGIIGGTKGSVSLGLGRALGNAFDQLTEDIEEAHRAFDEFEIGSQEDQRQAAEELEQDIERARERFGINLVRFLEEEGLTLSDLTAAAAAANIDISHLIGIIDGTLTPSVANLDAAFQEAADIMEHVASLTIGKLFEGFEGELDHLRLLINLVEGEFGDLNTQLSEFQRILRETSGIDLTKIPEEWRDVVRDLLTADITTPEGRTAVEAAIEAIIKGAKDLPREILGDLTPEQFFDFLSELEGLLDNASEEFADELGEATSFQIFRGITEITANRLLGVMQTDAFWNRQTALNTDQMVSLLGGTSITPLPPESFLDPFTALTAPSLEELSRFIAAAMPPQVVVEGFEVNFTLSGDVLDEDTAKEAGRIAADEFDRELGDSYIVKRRASGTRPTRVS